MKYLLYLFFAITLLGCSSNDNNIEDIEITPSTPTITFTVREVWASKLTWDYDNTVYDYDREICGVVEPTLAPNGGSDLTGFESYIGNHFALDTLVIDLSDRSAFEKPKYFDFRISERLDIRAGGRGKRHPEKIGHIEFIGFNSESRLILEQVLMDTEIINGERYAQIDYFSSNLSEEFIESITYDGQGKNYHTCKPKKVFHKKDYGDNYYESTIFKITVPRDEYNLDLNIGDTIGGNPSNKTLGDGWDARFKYLYLILDKE
jgi:hypothetical protein